MSTNDDCITVELDLDNPQLTWFLHHIWPHTIESRLEKTDNNGVERDWKVKSVKISFLVPDSNDINFNKIYKAWIKDGVIYLVMPLVPSMLLNDFGCMMHDPNHDVDDHAANVALCAESNNL